MARNGDNSFYRVFQLDLPQMKHLLSHQKCTIKSQKWYLYIHEMRILIKNYFIYQLLCFCGHIPYIYVKFTKLSVRFLLE